MKDSKERSDEESQRNNEVLRFALNANINFKLSERCCFLSITGAANTVR